MADPYKTLGVEKTATEEDIRKAYKKLAKKLPHTEHVCSRILSLPLFPDMTDQDADDVIAAVRRLLA